MTESGLAGTLNYGACIFRAVVPTVRLNEMSLIHVRFTRRSLEVDIPDNFVNLFPNTFLDMELWYMSYK